MNTILMEASQITREQIKQTNEMLRVLSDNSQHNWASDVNMFPMKNGFGVVWLLQGRGDQQPFLLLF